MNTSSNDILAPISQERPCGEDLSFSPEFDRIHEARREDDPTVDYGEWQATLKQADWKAVVECCIDLLQGRSKDLRLCAWLTEGLVKSSGLAGLGQGLEVTAALIERFGNDIHPQAEGDDQEQRVGSLSWLIVRVAQLVRQIPVTESKSGKFSLNDYESARLLQTQLQRNPESAGDLDNKVTLEKFSAAVAKTEKSRYTEWIANAERCRSALSELSRVTDMLFGLDGPSFSALNESIDAIRQRLQQIARDLGMYGNESAGSAPESNADGSSSGSAGEAARAMRSGSIRTRAEALQLLHQVAAFFRDTEPHSPVAYLADKAAHWGAMPLHSWLRSVVKDQGTLSHIEELLGVEAKSEKQKIDD